MKNILFVLVILILSISCKNESKLANEFNCNDVKIDNLKSINDFNKNFKLSIPSNWKTEFYFNEFQSEIFTADTTKQLTETYILKTSFNYGELKIDENFVKKTDSIIKLENALKLNSGFINFKSKPAYWYITKSKKNNFTLHQFNLLSKQSESTYFSAVTEIYGYININERICESIFLIESVEFFE